DLRLSLIEASQNEIGSPVDQVLLYCFHYDPRTGKYGLVIMNVLRLAGVTTVVVLAGFVLTMLWRDRRNKLAGVKAG
ncbi:MAG: SCO family protein, partial [candidate division KSB1 bacterium]|nr:SCO family protein [candidate division KSB1 bacterium]